MLIFALLFLLIYITCLRGIFHEKNSFKRLIYIIVGIAIAVFYFFVKIVCDVSAARERESKFNQ